MRTERTQPLAPPRPIRGPDCACCRSSRVEEVRTGTFWFACAKGHTCTHEAAKTCTDYRDARLGYDATHRERAR